MDFPGFAKFIGKEFGMEQQTDANGNPVDHNEYFKRRLPELKLKMAYLRSQIQKLREMTSASDSTFEKLQETSLGTGQDVILVLKKRMMAKKDSKRLGHAFGSISSMCILEGHVVGATPDGPRVKKTVDSVLPSMEALKLEEEKMSDSDAK